MKRLAISTQRLQRRSIQCAAHSAALLRGQSRTLRSCCQKRCSAQQEEGPHRLVLEARIATADNFAPFGQLISATDDGKEFDEEDAQLVLDRGPSPPRFYIMKLPRRGLTFDRITYHNNVTQCLGSVQPEPWYLVVAEPTGSVEEFPTVTNLHAFRVPHGSFVKLHMATWHAGPLFDGADSMSFFNLELADTNVVDHNTHHYDKQNQLFEVRETGKKVRWWTDTLREC